MSCPKQTDVAEALDAQIRALREGSVPIEQFWNRDGARLRRLATVAALVGAAIDVATDDRD